MRENPIAEHELYKVARCDPTEYRGDLNRVPRSTLSTDASRAFLRRFTLPVAATSPRGRVARAHGCAHSQW